MKYQLRLFPKIKIQAKNGVAPCRVQPHWVLRNKLISLAMLPFFLLPSMGFSQTESQDDGKNSEEFNPFPTEGGNDLTSLNNGLEKQGRAKSNLVKKARVGNNGFVKGIPSNNVGENYNSNSRKTRLQPSTTKRVTPKEPVPNRNLMKMNQPSKEVKKYSVNPRIRTFSSKEEGERKMKEHEERMKGFGSSLKSEEELPTGLNYFVQDFYSTNGKFYGSGVDPNGGDTKITQADLDVMIQEGESSGPATNQNYWKDVNLNKIFGDQGDIDIIYEYIGGIRKQINNWAVETGEEQRNHLEKMIDIFNLHSIDMTAADWLCYNINDLGFIYFNDVHDKQNSPFAKDNETNLQYDLTREWSAGIPIRFLSTMAKNGVAHQIMFTYIRDLGNDNVKDLDKKAKIELQTGEIFYENDNFSMDPNEYANEHWYGYINHPFEGWLYTSLSLCEYSLSNGQATLTDSPDNLVTSWSPVKGVVYPEDKNLEYFVGIENLENVETGEPTDILYNETRVGKAVTSEQVMDGSVNQVNYDMNVLWELTTGAYTPQNTLNALHNQKISVRDNTPPTFTSFPNDTIVDAGQVENAIGTPTGEDNSNLPLTHTYQVGDTPVEETGTYYKWAVSHTLTDKAGNTTDPRIQYVSEKKNVGIENLSNDKYLKIYPNPATDFINIEISEGLFSSSSNNFEVRISGINGIVYTSQEMTWSHPLTQINFSLKSLPTGILLVQIYQNGKLVAVQKIIKK